MYSPENIILQENYRLLSQTSSQCPIYYNQKRTGRPWIPNNLYVSGYCDETALPAYPFGFGLSYTQFEIDTPVLEKEKYFFNEPIKVK